MFHGFSNSLRTFPGIKDHASTDPNFYINEFQWNKTSADVVVLQQSRARKSNSKERGKAEPSLSKATSKLVQRCRNNGKAMMDRNSSIRSLRRKAKNSAQPFFREGRSL
uniref:Uncharacterized protein n=1 Tax=Rhizophagus irregularis (strain DAOM 181602 / DAOM 197198 / MUCL 43194) TaxID=747089 RepID=U9UI73_RHIID